MHASLNDRVGVEALNGSFLQFCVPHLSHWGAGVPGNWGWEGKGCPNARLKDKVSLHPRWACIPENSKGLKGRDLAGRGLDIRGVMKRAWGNPRSPCGHK